MILLYFFLVFVGAMLFSLYLSPRREEASPVPASDRPLQTLIDHGERTHPVSGPREQRNAKKG